MKVFKILLHMEGELLSSAPDTTVTDEVTGFHPERRWPKLSAHNLCVNCLSS